MPDNDLTLRIGTDASGVESGADVAKAEIGGIETATAGLGATFKGMGEAGLAALERITLGASSARTAIIELGESAAAARELVSGIGEAMIAIFAIGAITDWAKKMGEAGEKTEHTAQILGTGVGDVQQLSAAFTLVGVSADKGVLGMERLDKAFATARAGAKQQENAFKALGVSTAQNYTQMQLLGAVMDGFKAQADGPAKAAEAMALFGRSGAALIPFLDLGKSGMDELNQVTAQYGVIAPDAAEKAAQLGSAFNENKVAMSGLGNVMAEAFAPALTVVVQGMNQMIAAFIQSYDKGGMAKMAVDFLVDDFKALVTVVGFVGLVFVEAFDLIVGVIDTFKADWALVVDSIKGEINQLKDQFVALGHVIFDALSQNIWAAAKDMQAAESKMVTDAHNAAVAIQKGTAAIASAFAPAGNAMISAYSGYDKFTASLASGSPHHQRGTTGEAADGDTSGDASKTPKKGKTGGDAGDESDTQALQEKFDAEENAHNTMLRDMTADELAYWSTVKTNVQGGALTSKDAAEIRMKVATLTHTVAMQEIQSEIAARKDAESQAIGDITAEQTARKAAIEQQIKDVEEAEKRGETTHAAAHAKILALIEEEQKSAIDAATAIEAQHIAADQAIMAMTDSRTKEFQAAQKDMADAATVFEKARVAADNAANKQIDEQAQAAANRFKQSWDGMINPLVSSFTSGLLKMAEGTQSLATTMRNMGQQILNDMLNVVDKMVERWLWGQVQQITATRAATTAKVAAEQTGASQTMVISGITALKQVTNSAVKAAGEAYSALAGIPVIGPALGAGAAAVTFAAVEAFGGLIASAAGGYDIPSGVNPMTQLHAREMVLPASLADTVRGLAANDSFPNSNQSGGGNHYHTHTWQITGAIDGPSLRRVLQANRSDHAAAMESLVRSRNGRGF